MKNYITLLVVAAMSVTLFSCSKEDTPTPQFHSPAPFYMPADTAMDATSQMRREFYKNTGSYLLFNDTIQKNYIGTDINGDDVYTTETIDIGYYIGFEYSSSDTYTYTYLTDYETQKEMTDYVNDYVLYHFKGSMKPFLYFICNTITVKFRAGNTSTPYASSGQRGVAIATNYLLQRKRTEAQKKAYAERIINAVIGQLANNFSEDFTDFYTYSSAYYNTMWSSYGDNQAEILARLGFIGSGNMGVYCPSQSDDLSQYALATVQYSQEEWEKKYADYPVIIAKYKFVKRVFTEHGFQYDK